MSLKTWAGFRVSADNAHGVIRPTGRSGCRRAPGPPESLAGLATAPGFSSPTCLHVAEHRLQAEQAGIAQGAQFVEADAGEDLGAAQRIGAAQGLLQLAGTVGQGAGANGGRAALDGMQGRGAALDIALAELAFELGEEVLHIRNEAPQHLDDQPSRRRNARRYRPAPRPVRPRPLSLPAPCRRSCRDDRADKAPCASCRSASPHGRSCPPPCRLRGRPARRWRSYDRQPGEAPVGADSPGRSRPSISGICMSISTASNGTLASSTAERPPAHRRRGLGALAAQQLGGDLAVQRVVLHYQTHAPQPLGAPPGAAAGWPGRPVHRAGHAAPSRPAAWA